MKRLLVVALLALAACDLLGPVTGPMPAGAVRVQPTAQDSAVWSRIEGCSGLSRNIGEIAWFVVPGAWDLGNGNAAQYQYGGSVYTGLITMADYVSDLDPFIGHEVLHALLRGPDAKDKHPAKYFKEKCGALVAQSDK